MIQHPYIIRNILYDRSLESAALPSVLAWRQNSCKLLLEISLQMMPFPAVQGKI